MIRRATRWLLPLVTTLVTLLGPAAPVFADAPNPFSGVADAATCKTAPDPQTPDGGMANILVDSGGIAYADPNAQAPNPDVAPTGKDPFVGVNHTTIYREYGFGGLSWTTYDLGCIGTATSYPMNSAANLIERVPVSMTGLAQTTTEALQHPTFMSIFDPLIDNTAKGIQRSFTALLPLTLLACCIWLIWSFRRGSLSEGIRGAGWMLLIFAVTMLFLQAPTQSVKTMDNGLTEVTGTLDQAFGDYQTQVGEIHSELLYRTWLAGTFGDADSAAAKAYGPGIFKASTYSWAEMKDIETNPDHAQGIKEGKQQAFKDTAEQVRQADPIAYEHLTGAHTDNRLWRAVFNGIGVAAATFFQLLAALSALLAFIAIRLFVLAWPVMALLGLMPSQRTMVLNLVSWLTGRLIAAVFLLFVSRLTAVLIGAVLGSHGLPGWLTVLLLTGIVVGAWKLCRAHRQMAGSHHLTRLMSKVGSAVIGYEIATHAVHNGMEPDPSRPPAPQPPPAPSAPSGSEGFVAEARTRVEVSVDVPVAAGPAVTSGAPALDPGPVPEPAPPSGRGPVYDARPMTDPDGRVVYRVMDRPVSDRPEVNTSA